MCDTLAAVGNSTVDGSVIFGKNSDRPPNESQVIRHIPGMNYPEGSTLRCTYIEIPQVAKTYEVLLSCPFWMWGAEMGINERGVAIGNEAVWSKEFYADTGLLGMDLLRLGLERGETAEKALHVITKLIEDYGQGGYCFLNEPMKYHNSFIIADPHEAWVLETADRHWVAQRIRDVRSISNGYTIGSRWDLASQNLVEHAVHKGWCESAADFHFARCYADPGMEQIVHCRERVNRSGKLLQGRLGGINVKDMMNFLKDHDGFAINTWNPDKQIQTLCMHAGPGVMSHSTASCVAHLKKQAFINWMTGGSTPCLSVYIPFYPGSGIPEIYSKGKDKYEDSSFWWRHEKLVRKAQEDYPRRACMLIPEMEELQNGFLKEAEEVESLKTVLSLEEKNRISEDFTKKCTRTLIHKHKEWHEHLITGSLENKTDADYLRFLEDLNKASDINL